MLIFRRSDEDAGESVTDEDNYSSNLKSGLNVNQASAGKKIIGTASPGKSSGFFTVKGREIDMGTTTAANERTASRI